MELDKREGLLIVDDDSVNREILKHIFAGTYAVYEAGNGREGLRMILERQEGLCAVLLDVVMPEMDGMETLRRLEGLGLLKQLPMFLITAEASDAVLKEAYALGVMDVISKPVVPYVVRRRVGSVIELFQARRRLRRVVESQAEEIIQLNQGMVAALATAIEFRSKESGDHVHRIYTITKRMFSETALGNGLEPSEIEEIALASTLHDVGKIAVPDSILNKPGRLTAGEFEVMKTHTTQGANLLSRIPQLRSHRAYQYAVDIARHHHERWDGRGYPDSLQGEEISLWAQVVSLADVYDALRCKRVYKDAFPRERVLKMIRNEECGAFNPELLRCFFQLEGKLAQMYEGERI